MSLDRTIAEIEWLERIFAMPDTRPVTQAISRLRIDGTTKLSPIVRGFGSGGRMASVAEPTFQYSG
jgi:hypothetical protein